MVIHKIAQHFNGLHFVIFSSFTQMFESAMTP